MKIVSLLRGYEAASHWYSRDLLARYGATPKPGRIVIDRNRATGGGMTAGVDFGIAMLGVLAGQDVGRVTEPGLMTLAAAPAEPLVAAPVSR